MNGETLVQSPLNSTINYDSVYRSKWSNCVAKQSAMEEGVLSPTNTSSSTTASGSSVCENDSIIMISPGGSSASSSQLTNDSSQTRACVRQLNSLGTDSISIGASSQVRSLDSLATTEVCRNSKTTDWTIPRWKDLEDKRLALCQKRVNLERRLFEFSNMRTSTEKQLYSEATPLSKSKDLKRSSASSTTSHSSVGSSDDSNNGYNLTKKNTFKLRRFLIKNDQDPVLWSGPVNRKNLPDGNGRMVFSDGQVYEGSVVAGLRHGKGANVWPNGQIYTGSWIQNSRSGRGTHRWPDGRTVTGPWLNGHLHGRVFFRWPDGASYDGDTIQGLKEGRGIHTWKDGRVYSGQYKNGSENGFGTLTEKNQHTKYRGQFVDGKRHGYGIQIWKTKTYDGEWKQNMIHGRGKLSWLSGACYTGEFQDGQYHGIGSYRSESGTKYIGHWKDGYKHGHGKQYWPDGKFYQGNFEYNKRHGYGRMVYPDGTIYSGGWEHGKRCGRGIEVISMLSEVSGRPHQEIRHCGLWDQDEAIISKETTNLDVSTDDSQIMLSTKGKLPYLTYAKRIIGREFP